MIQAPKLLNVDKEFLSKSELIRVQIIYSLSGIIKLLVSAGRQLLPTGGRYVLQLLFSEKSRNS
jgi:hypothetical protein